MKYKIKFKGVLNSSIGNKKGFTLVIEAGTFKEANLKIYDTHEHIFIESVNGKVYSYIDNTKNPI